jgi:hypothetical protein
MIVDFDETTPAEFALRFLSASLGRPIMGTTGLSWRFDIHSESSRKLSRKVSAGCPGNRSHRAPIRQLAPECSTTLGLPTANRPGEFPPPTLTAKRADLLCPRHFDEWAKILADQAPSELRGIAALAPA